ncbi:hypothetical protein [Hydrogenimonas sp.]
MRARLYRRVAAWCALFALAVAATGLWLAGVAGDGFRNPVDYSLQTRLKIVTAHLFGMGALLFVLLHFLLFAQATSMRRLVATAVGGTLLILSDQLLAPFLPSFIALPLSFATALLFAAVATTLLFRARGGARTHPPWSQKAEGSSLFEGRSRQGRSAESRSPAAAAESAGPFGEA